MIRLLILLLVLAAAPAVAQMPTVPIAGTNLNPYVGPCDVAAANGVSITDWIGLRACSSQDRGAAAVTACHSTAGVDDGCADLITSFTTGFLVPAVVDGTHTCPGSGCNIKKAYNKGTRTGVDWLQPTVANRPSLVANCINTSFPCLQAAASQSVSVLTGPIFNSAGVSTLVSVLQRPTCGATAAWRAIAQSGTGATGNRITVQPSGTGNCGYQLGGGSGNILSSVTGTTGWHSVLGVVNGAASLINVDGTETTGTVTGTVANTSSVSLQPSASASDAFNETELGFLEATAATSALRHALCVNQTAAWGLSSAGC